MITVKFSENKESKTISLKVTGHAGQAENGKDIICASMVTLDVGNAEVIITPKTEHYGEALHTYFVAQIGYTLLAKNYPQFVELTSFE